MRMGEHARLGEYECAVLGGGIVGVACAEALARAGVRTVLLEADRLASGATGRSGAVVRVTHAESRCRRQAAFGLTFYRRLVNEQQDRPRGGGVSISNGYLHFAPASRLEEAEADLATLGVPVELLPLSLLAARFPELTIDSPWAVFEPLGGYMDAARVTWLLAAKATAAGADIREGIRAERLDSESGSIVGVTTNAGYIRVPRVVVALGGGAPGFAERNGIAEHGLWIQRIQATLFRGDTPLPRVPCFVDEQNEAYGRYCPLSRGLYVGLPTGRIEPQASGGVMCPKHAELTRRAGMRRLKWLANASVVGGLVHTDCYGRDAGGHIGTINNGPSGLYQATGFGGGGFKMAPYAAARVAAEIAGSPSPDD